MPKSTLTPKVQEFDGNLDEFVEKLIESQKCTLTQK